MNDVHFFRTPELMDTSLDVVKQMQKANEAEKLNRQPPKPRPMMDRESFLAACQILLRKEKPFDPNLVTISWITGQYSGKISIILNLVAKKFSKLITKIYLPEAEKMVRNGMSIFSNSFNIRICSLLNFGSFKKKIFSQSFIAS